MGYEPDRRTIAALPLLCSNALTLGRVVELMHEMEFLLLALAVFALIVAPILAISAFTRVRRLETRAGTEPGLLQRLYPLEQKLAAVEQQLAGLARRLVQVERELAGPPAAAAEPTPAHPPAPTAVPTPGPQPARPSVPSATTPPGPPSVPTPKPSSQPLAAARHAAPRLDLETLIAGKWLNRLGILALLFAVSFFIKYAFDNNWVGPRGRVAIGLLLGSALLPWSGWLLRRGYRYFSEGIAGLGAAVLYLSIWAGWHYYRLFEHSTAFAGMIVVTAAMIVVAVGRDSQRVALLALAGGFLTPLLVSTGKDEQLVLFSYLAVLAAGLLLLARARDWYLLAPVSFFATQVFFWGWYETFYRPEKLLRTSLFATLFFLIFAAQPVIRSRREGRLAISEMAVVLLNALAYLLALRATLWPEHRWTLTLVVLGLVAAHLVVARGLPPPAEASATPVARSANGGALGAQPIPGEGPLVSLLFAGLALTFATLAIPIRLDGKWITMAWAVEGTILVWSGQQARQWALRAAGLLLFAIVAVRLAVLPIPAQQFLLNARFAAFAVAVASFAAAGYFVGRAPTELQDTEKTLFAVLGVGVNIYALAALSLEAWDLFGRMGTLGIERGLAQQLALSVVWTVYATVLILAGVKRRVAALRWQALALFGLVAGKVFLFDLSFLERFYRILSFLLLGLVLLVVSFLYQHKVAAEEVEKEN